MYKFDVGFGIYSYIFYANLMYIWFYTILRSLFQISFIHLVYI